MKVMIVVTHLLGSGHLTRALTLGRAFRAGGHAVTVVSGGGTVGHLDASPLILVQLPPLRSDGTNFSRLLDETGAPASPTYMAMRETLLKDTAVNFTPDVLITELFPFGRRVLTSEFLSLLQYVKSLTMPPLVLASIRDILAPPSKPAKAERAAEILTEHYDAVLVHSVEDMVPLSASWPVTATVSEKLHYTGFVAPPPPEHDAGSCGAGEVLVSAGGGAVGDGVFHAAVEAASLDPKRHWRILVGGTDTAPRIKALLARATSQNLTIEPARPDFRTLLAKAACSVSLCGYNTALDVLQTRTPALFIPFDDGGEVEQGLRADTLSQQPGLDVIRSRDLTGPRLAEAVRSLVNQQRVLVSHSNMRGAETSVQIAETLVAQR